MLIKKISENKKLHLFEHLYIRSTTEQFSMEPSSKYYLFGMYRFKINVFLENSLGLVTL